MFPEEQGDISWKNSSKNSQTAAFKSAPALVFLAPVEAAFGVPAHLNVGSVSTEHPAASSPRAQPCEMLRPPSNCHPVVGQHWSEPKLPEAHFFLINDETKNHAYSLRIENTHPIHEAAALSQESLKICLWSIKIGHVCIRRSLFIAVNISVHIVFNLAERKIMSDRQMDAQNAQNDQQTRTTYHDKTLNWSLWVTIIKL